MVKILSGFVYSPFFLLMQLGLIIVTYGAFTLPGDGFWAGFLQTSEDVKPQHFYVACMMACISGCFSAYLCSFTKHGVRIWYEYDVEYYFPLFAAGGFSFVLSITTMAFFLST